MRDEDAMRKLIADALAKADVDVLRGVVAAVVKQQLEEYQIRDIVTRAVTPVVQEMVAKLLNEPDVQAVLAARVKSESLALIGRLFLETRR